MEVVHNFKNNNNIINDKAIKHYIVGRKLFSLLAMTLEVSLEITLHRLIGLYWVFFVGFLIFGMRTMYVSLSLEV